MGIFEDIGNGISGAGSSFGEALSGAVSTVSNSINRGLSDLGNSINNIGKNATDDVARSDLGKAAGAGLAPVSAAWRGSERLISGDFKGAGTTFLSGATSANPLVMAASASSSLKDAMRTDNILNPLTFDYFKQTANVSDITQKGTQGGALSWDELHAIGQQELTGAALVGAGYAAATYGGSAITAAKGLTFEKIAAGGGLLSNLLKGNLKAVVDGLGAPDWLTNLVPNVGGGDRAPASTLPSSSAIGSSGTSGTAGLLIAGALLIAFIIFLARRFK